MKKMSCILFIAAIFLGAASALAVDYYWTNAAEDGVYTNPANWTPNGLPDTTDYTPDVVVLNSAYCAPSTITRLAYFQPDWTSLPTINHIRFDDAGWTFASYSPIDYLATLNSQGVGTNTVTFIFSQNGYQTWNIGEGNTLHLTASFYARDKTVTIDGGGTLLLGSAFSGFGDDHVYGIIVKNATLRVNANDVSYIGRAWINARQAKVQLRTTLANANNLIGHKILDSFGYGLKAKEIGDGFVEIAPAIDPGTILIAQ